MNNFEKATADLAEATNLVTNKTRSGHQNQLKEIKESIEDKEKRYLANQSARRF